MLLIVFVLLFALGAGLRLFDLTRESLWFDEGCTLGYTAPELGPWPIMARWQMEHDIHPPLYYILARLVRNVQDSVFAIRFFSAAASIGALGLCAWTAWRNWGVASSMAALGFLAISRFAIFYAQEARVYSLTLLLAYLSLMLFLRHLDRREPPSWPEAIGLGLANALLFHTGYLTALWSIAQAGFFMTAWLVWRRVDAWKATPLRWLTGSMLTSLLSAPLLPVLAMQLPIARDAAWAAPEARESLFSFWSRLLYGYPGGAWASLTPFAIAGAVLILSLVGWRAWRSRDVKALACLALFLGPPILAWGYSLLLQPVLVPRGLIPCLAATSLIVGLLASPAGPKWERRVAFAALAILLSVDIASMCELKKRTWKDAHKDAANLIKPLLDEKTGLVFTPIVARYCMTPYLGPAITQAAVVLDFPCELIETESRTASPGAHRVTTPLLNRAKKRLSELSHIIIVDNRAGPGTVDTLAGALGLEWRRMRQWRPADKNWPIVSFYTRQTEIPPQR